MMRLSPASFRPPATLPRKRLRVFDASTTTHRRRFGPDSRGAARRTGRGPGALTAGVVGSRDGERRRIFHREADQCRSPCPRPGSSRGREGSSASCGRSCAVDGSVRLLQPCLGQRDRGHTADSELLLRLDSGRGHSLALTDHQLWTGGRHVARKPFPPGAAPESRVSRDWHRRRARIVCARDVRRTGRRDRRR